MSFSLNKIQLIGVLGKDAETRFTTNNVSVTSFSLATTHSYKKNEDWVNETTWHNCVSFNLSDYFKSALMKGKKFYVEGRLTKRDYTDKEGIKRYSTDVFVEKLIPLEATQRANDVQDEPEQTQPANNTGTDDQDLPF